MRWIRIKPTLIEKDDTGDLIIRYTPLLVWGDVEIPGPFFEEWLTASKEDHDAARANARKALLDSLRSTVDHLSKG